MTVVVGVLNRRGASIAADSATTIFVDNKNSDGRTDYQKTKIVNSGNKMLRLSDVMPIGVMIVNTAYILNIPWDVIIRWYRKKKGYELFPTVEAIAKDFLDFVPQQDFFMMNSLVMKWDYETELVFTGYGKEQKYPQLVHITIKGVRNGKLKIDPQDINVYTITDEHPSDILYFGQTDITATLTEDLIEDEDNKELCEGMIRIFLEKRRELAERGLIDDLDLSIPDCYGAIKSAFNERHRNMRQKWYDTVKDYSLQEMASLAETLIKATELHRNIMFKEETVGGLIDLAVISREDGFQWLNRKSWYEPSKGGQYGKFGI